MVYDFAKSYPVVPCGGENPSRGGHLVDALLLRVGADQSEGAGFFNGPVNSRTREFAYVPIPETAAIQTGMATPYSLVVPPLQRSGVTLTSQFTVATMHLDPDFRHLTYGDQGQRASQIQTKLTHGDLIVFYAGLRDVHSSPRLVYALIGLYVIDAILPASSVPSSRWHENVHTRRVLPSGASDIVIRAQSGVSGRLERCLPIGSFRVPSAQPNKRPSYRVEPTLLATWGGLSIADGFLQRSARLPRFLDAAKFYGWFLNQKPTFIKANN